jgi:hypothetical protein
VRPVFKQSMFNTFIKYSLASSAHTPMCYSIIYIGHQWTHLGHAWRIQRKNNILQSFRGPCNRFQKSSFFGAKLRFRIEIKYVGSMYTLVDLGQAKKMQGFSSILKCSWPIGGGPIFSASLVLANLQKLDRDCGLNQKLELQCENIGPVVPYMFSHKLFECLDTLSHARTDRASSLPLHGKIGFFVFHLDYVQHIVCACSHLTWAQCMDDWFIPHT